jgi:hypothetical protein
MNARYRAHRTVRLVEFSSAAWEIKLSIPSIIPASNIDHSAVKRTILRGYEDPRRAGGITTPEQK